MFIAKEITLKLVTKKLKPVAKFLNVTEPGKRPKFLVRFYCLISLVKHSVCSLRLTAV